MRARARRWLATLASLASWALPAPARAGNDEGFLLGNQAALTGGAVTADVAEGSAIWYNPAGLAAVRTPSLDLSASAYGIRTYSAPGFLRASNGDSVDLKVSELIIVPTALSIVRPLSPRLSAGFGLFVPRGNDLILRGELNAGTDGRWLLSQVEYDRITYGGASLGWAIDARLRVGFSALVSYEYEQTGLQLAGGDPSDTDASFISLSSVSTRSVVGALLSAGVQWDVSRDWKLGASLRSPSFDLYRSEANSGFVTSSLRSEEQRLTGFNPESAAQSRRSFAQTQPWQLRAGLARVWGDSSVAVDADLQPAVRQGEVQHAPRLNLRLGGQYQLTELVAIGAGAFTDRDSRARTAQDAPLHFYGGSVGVRWGKRYRLQSERPKTFEFSSTLALRYAVGRGQTQGLGVAALDGTTEPVTNPWSRIVVHELMLHVGSGFYF